MGEIIPLSQRRFDWLVIDLVHTYARNFDPLVLARPVWWKVAIWFDVLGFGPFYAIGLYAYIRGKEWIRLPSSIYSSVLFTIVTIILAEETFGPSKAPHLWVVYLDNAPWFLMPIAIITRMYLSEHPFTRVKSARQVAVDVTS